MSQENVESVRRIYATMNLSVPGSVGQLRAPRESWGSLIDPDIEWCGPREFPDLAEPVFGHEGIVAYAAKLAEALDDYRSSTVAKRSRRPRSSGSSSDVVGSTITSSLRMAQR